MRLYVYSGWFLVLGAVSGAPINAAPFSGRDPQEREVVDLEVIKLQCFQNLMLDTFFCKLL